VVRRSYANERRLVGGRVFQQAIAVVDDQLFDDVPRVAGGLGRRQHIERYRQRAPLGDVHQPQASPGELPLNVAVSLRRTYINTPTHG